MPMISPLAVACLTAAAFALISFPAGNLRAQPPFATEPDKTLAQMLDSVRAFTSGVPISATAPADGSKRRSIATCTLGYGQKITSRSSSRRFRGVSLQPGEIVDIALQLPRSLSDFASAQPLDGGQVISFSKNHSGVSSAVAIRFQAGNQPGLYRVLIPGSLSPMLQFWVADAQNSKGNPSVVNSTPEGSSR